MRGVTFQTLVDYANGRGYALNCLYQTPDLRFHAYLRDEPEKTPKVVYLYSENAETAVEALMKALENAETNNPSAYFDVAKSNEPIEV